MTLLEFLSPHLENYFNFKIEKTSFRLQINIRVESSELNECLLLSITKVHKSNEVSVYLRDQSPFGSDCYILNRCSIVKHASSEESISNNSDYIKFRDLVKQYVSANS